MSFSRWTLHALPLAMALCTPLLDARAGSLTTEFQAIRAQATELAGEPGDIPQRARVLREIFIDSGGSHAFPLVAAHGALWAHRYFDQGGTVATLIAQRYFYDPEEKAKRLAMLETFMDALKRTNRQVFIDTYTNYQFSKLYGQRSEAPEFLPKELLDNLNRMHQYRARGVQLPKARRRELFMTALLWEQESMVAQAVESAVAAFDCPILKALALKPLVRFEYFPRTRFFAFEDFSSKQERITRAVQSYELAEDAGWETVLRTLNDYGPTLD